MKLNAGCELIFEAIAPIPLILMLRPRSGHGQWILREEYLLEPTTAMSEYSDSYGNLCQRLITPTGRFRIRTNTWVETVETIDVQPGAPFTLVQDLPEPVLQFLLPSRYCPSDQFGAIATEIVGDREPGYDQVEAIRHWIHTQIQYQYGVSNSSTDAMDTYQQRSGVCRDFVHLGLSLCRSLSIPGRMVVGYLYDLKPMDLHAWFEAFVGDRWYIFDATQAEPRGNRIAIGYGRDAADVALSMQFGPLELLTMNVWVNAVDT